MTGEDDRFKSAFTPEQRAGVTLANWRLPEQAAWAFQNVREIVPTALVRAGDALPFVEAPRDVGSCLVGSATAPEETFDAVMAQTWTSGVVVLHRGALVHEWYRVLGSRDAEHLLFSVSKSITALLAGQLVGDGLLDCDATIATYLPEVAGSAYEDATVRHVLDMTVSSPFDESYLNVDGDYARYRAATGWNPMIAGPEGGMNTFLTSMPRGKAPHGAEVHYLSPNSDLLGWVIERVTGRRYADLLSERLWQPCGAQDSASVTVDAFGAPRTAGGVSATVRDLARLGELVRCEGRVGLRQVVPQEWIADLFAQHDRSAWLAGDMATLFPEGNYRSKWYQTGATPCAICAIGIHGQWLFVDRERELVIARTAAQPEPVDEALDHLHVAAFDAMADAVAGA
ncbi:MAG: serine hydrolase [Pseudomonadota bacterium]